MSKGNIINTKIDIKLYRNSVVYSVLLQILIKAKGILILPIMTYFLLPSELGIWKMITATATMLPPFITLNLLDGGAVFFCETSDKEKIKDMYSTILNFTIIFFLILFIPLYFILYRFKPSVSEYFIYVVMIVFVSILDQFSVYLYIVFHQNKKLMIYKLFKEYIGFFLIFILIINKFGYKGAIYGNVIAVLLVSAYNLYNTLREIGYKFSINFVFLKRALPLSITLLPVFSMVWIMNSIDVYFVATYRGTNEVGIYGVAYSVSSLVLFLSESLNYFWFPLVTRTINNSIEEFNILYKKVVRFAIYIGSVAALSMSIASPLLINILSGSSYRKAANILGLISLAYIIQMLIKIFTAPVYSIKKPFVILISNIAGAGLNIILNFLLIPSYGIVGASISTFTSYLLVMLMLMFFVNFKMKFKVINIEIIVLFIVTSSLFIVFNLIKFNNYLYEICLAISLAALYGAIWYLKLDMSDKNAIKRALEKIKFLNKKGECS